jgi:hypothetical protein
MTIKQISTSSNFLLFLSRKINVPKPWKKLISPTGHFRFDIFLQHPNVNPFCMRAIIALRGVRDTLHCLNWGFLKHQASISCSLCRRNLKSDIARTLHFWTNRTVMIVFKLQSILLSIDIHRALITNSRSNDIINVILRNDEPLDFCLFSSLGYP